MRPGSRKLGVMQLFAIVYLGGWVLASILCVAFSDWIRERFMGAPTHLGLTAVLAGALWPVLAVGLAQFGVIAAAVRLLARRPLPAATPVSGRAHPAADSTPADAAQQSSEA